MGEKRKSSETEPDSSPVKAKRAKKAKKAKGEDKQEVKSVQNEMKSKSDKSLPKPQNKVKTPKKAKSEGKCGVSPGKDAKKSPKGVKDKTKKKQPEKEEESEVKSGTETKKPPKRVKDKARIKAANEAKKAAKKGLAEGQEAPGQDKALKYLDTWANDRGKWKFEKCRQIWLLQNAYDAKRIDDAHFDQLLLYFGSIQGQMRTVAQKDAQKVLDDEAEWLRKKEQGKTDTEIIIELKRSRKPESVINRAREVLAILE